MRNGEKINTLVHYKYICREGKYAHLDGRKEDLIYFRSGNLPVWACNNPAEFWKQAEAHRGANGNGYREILLGLQEELSLEDNIALVESFLEKTGISSSHVFSYAIHDKEAAFDKNHRNIHCHLMFNEKIIERNRPLEADKFFKRFSVNKDNEPTQGYKTNRCFQSRLELIRLRQLWQDLINEKLAENAIEARVDCRTLEVQHAEKIAEGKLDEAKYFDRKPAKHLGKEFQNPKEQKEICKQCEENLQSELQGKEGVYPEPVNSHEAKKMLFMRDFVVRKIARLIQAAKKEQLAKARKLANYIEREENKNSALVVTNTDIIQYEEEHIAELKNKINALELEYRSKAPMVISDRRSFAKAMYAVYGNEYNQNKKDPAKIKIYMQDPLVLAKKDEFMDQEYLKLAMVEVLGKDYKELTYRYNQARALKGKLVKEYEEVKLKLYENRTRELLELRSELYAKLLNNNRETHALAQQLQAYKDEAARPETQAQIEDVAGKIKAHNDVLKAELKEIYKGKIQAEQELKQAENILHKAQELPSDTVIFADKFGSLTTVNTKLYGETKLGSLKLVNIANDTYCLLPGDNNSNEMKAIKLLDDITRGKLPVYTIKVERQEKGQAKTYSVRKTAVRIPVYKVKTKDLNSQSVPFDSAKKNVIEEVVKEALKTENINIAPIWPEVDDTIVDELERELDQDKLSNYLRL